MESLSAGSLRIEIEEAAPPAPLRLRWLGRSADRNPSAVIGPWFTEVSAHALAAGHAIEMRFEALEHFNSSTIACIIQLIQQARGKGVRLAIVYDPAVKWQRLAFEALRVLAKGDGLFELKTATAGEKR